MKNETIVKDDDFFIKLPKKAPETEPFFYLKFCQKEQYANDVCNGDFYANTAAYFRQKELETGNRGQGDQDEMRLSLNIDELSFYDPATGALLMSFKNTTGKLQRKNDDLFALVCFVGIPRSEMHVIYESEKYTVFQLPFTEKDFQMMCENFGEYCVVIEASELKNRIDSICGAEDYDHVFGAVKYCVQNYLSKINAFFEGSKERFLYKNEDLSYQREYRLVIGATLPKDHFLHFGRLETAKLHPSEELRNMKFRVAWISDIETEEDADGTKKTD